MNSEKPQGVKTPTKITAALSGEIKFPLKPEDISTIALYHVHRNLWGSLLADSDTEGEGLANITALSEDKRSYTITLKAGARFSNGQLISSEDVIASINRLRAHQKAGHFNANKVIEKISALSETAVQIDLHRPTPSLPYLLSIPELGIVPRESISEDGKLISCAITSGAYTVLESSEQVLTLKKNPHFVAYSKEAPDIVELHNISQKSRALKKALELQLDFIEAYTSADLELLQQMQLPEQYQKASTRPSLSIYLILDDKSLSTKERIAIADLLSQGLSYQYNSEVEKPSYELLPPKTFGSLNLSTALNANRSKSGDLPESLTFRASKSDLNKSIVDKLEEAGVQVNWIDHKSKESWDVKIIAQGMGENYPELASFLVMLSPYASIPVSEDDKANLEAALHATNDEARYQHIQKLGRSLLEEARIVPLFVRSYLHIFNSEKIALPEGPNYDGDIRFYEMQVVE